MSYFIIFCHWFFNISAIGFVSLSSILDDIFVTKWNWNLIIISCFLVSRGMIIMLETRRIFSDSFFLRILSYCRSQWDDRGKEKSGCRQIPDNIDFARTYIQFQMLRCIFCDKKWCTELGTFVQTATVTWCGVGGQHTHTEDSTTHTTHSWDEIWT